MVTTKDDRYSRPKRQAVGPDFVFGVLATVVLGPIGLIAAGLAVLAIVTNLIAGLDPVNWFSSSFLDNLVGGGAGAFVRWVVFMVGAMTASGCAADIQAAFRR